MDELGVCTYILLMFDVVYLILLLCYLCCAYLCCDYGRSYGVCTY